MSLKLFDSLIKAELLPDARTYSAAILACFKGQQVWVCFFLFFFFFYFLVAVKNLKQQQYTSMLCRFKLYAKVDLFLWFWGIFLFFLLLSPALLLIDFIKNKNRTNVVTLK